MASLTKQPTSTWQQVMRLAMRVPRRSTSGRMLPFVPRGRNRQGDGVVLGRVLPRREAIGHHGVAVARHLEDLGLPEAFVIVDDAYGQSARAGAGGAARSRRRST